MERDVDGEEEMKLLHVKKSYSQGIWCFKITNRLIIAVLAECWLLNINFVIKL